MKLERATLIAGMIILLGVLAAGVTLWRLVGPEPETEGDRRRRIVHEDAERVYESIRMTDDIASPDDVWPILESAPFKGEEFLEPAEKAALLETVSTFVALRFGQDDPAAYRQWREYNGDVMRSEDDLLLHQSIDWAYENLTGKSYTKGQETAATFDDLWRARRRMHDGFNEFEGIAAEPKGLSVVAGLWTENSAGLRVGGHLTDEQWYGAASTMHHSWFVGGSYVADPPADDEPIVTVQVGFIAAFGAGPRRPFTLGLFWDEREQRWLISSLMSHGGTSGSGKLYPIDF